MRRVVCLVVLSALSCCPDDEGSSAFSVAQSPIIGVDPDPVAFESVLKGDSATITVTIGNSLEASGVLALETVQLAATRDLTITQPEALTLEPGQSTTMTVTYAPTDDEADGGQLLFRWRNSVETKAVNIITAAQSGALLIEPSPIAFGLVPSGQSKVRNVRILNNGTGDIPVGKFTITAGTSDFTIVGVYHPVEKVCPGLPEGAGLEGNQVVPAGGGLCVDVSYTPKGSNADNGVFAVNPPFDPENIQTEPLLTAAITGDESAPRVVLNPEKLEFGALDIDEAKELEFTIKNAGNANLVLSSVAKNGSTLEIWNDVTVVTQVAADTVVVPHEGNDDNAIAVTVRFKPTKSYAATNGTIGSIVVASNDPQNPAAEVKIFGDPKAPKLQVTPPELVDFGVVAQGHTSKRSLIFTNTGTSALQVTGVALADAAGGEFSILDAPEDPMVIGAGDFRTVDLQYKNTGGAVNEVVNGKLAFASNDPGGATSVALRAQRTDKATCKLKLDPATVNFGVVGYGGEKVVTVNVTNIGSSPCSPYKVALADGSSGIIPGSPATCTAPVALVNHSDNFAVLNEPPGIKDFLQPGQTIPLQVKYVPQVNLFSEAFSFGELVTVSGLLQVFMYDYANLTAEGDPTEVRVPDVAGAQPAACNLTGKSGPAAIAAIPGNVEFDLTTVGCFSKTEEVKVYNNGKAPVHLCGIELDGSCPEFKLKNVPPIPSCANGGAGYVLSPGNPITFGVVYGPQDLNPDGCTILVTSDQPDLTIPLSGAGTYDTHQTDIYTQLSGQVVDVLFVVDDSGSMSEEQDNLASNISAFVATAAQWQTDFHIGVVSTDIDDANATKGELLTDGGTQPRFFTTQSGINGFAQTVKGMGTNGSGTEQGLEAGKMALSSPLTIEKGAAPKACATDTECVKPLKCTPSVLETNKKYCMGWNAEFIRDDAVLEVVFVSDEEDQSSAGVTFYQDFFRSIKGFANTGLFHAHAIVGDSGGGCSSADGAADAGERYIDLANLVGGKVKSICDNDWAAILEDLGNIAFGLKVQFFLSRPPIVDTITVEVDGQNCTTGWSYDEAANAILFENPGPCMPQEGQEIVIDYDVFCFGG